MALLVQTSQVGTMQVIKLKKLDGQEWDNQRERRVNLAQRSDPDSLQQLLNQYWTWHYDNSLAEVARVLLGAELNWERTPSTLTPPVESLVSPLGYALDHEDVGIREGALRLLDSTVNVPAGEVLIGEELEPVQVDK